MIAAIFAVDEDDGIGLNGSMPWPHNKSDMVWFKRTTQHHVVVMGRNTWESTGILKPLPNRVNVVATTQPLDTTDAIVISGDVCIELSRLQQEHYPNHIFVIGGANILLQSLPVLDRIYITRIEGKYNCSIKLDTTQFIKGFKLVSKMLFEFCAVETYERIS